MIRTYADWEHDARTTTKSITQLGNELRDHWDTWKSEAPYDSWEACILSELGITAEALRKRNERSREKSQRDNSHGAIDHGDAPERRQVPNRNMTPAEVDRRRHIVAQMFREGCTRRVISDTLNVADGTITADLAALGLGGRRPTHQLATEEPEGDFRWRNEDLGIADEESTIEQPSFVSCTTPSASEAIEDIRVQLSLILGGRYRLSLKDRNNLITVLTNALERLHNGNQETQDSSDRSRFAG